MQRLLSLFFLVFLAWAAAPESDLVQSCCRHATYPAVCLDTLSSASSSSTPAGLAQAAVNASIVRAGKTRAYLARLSSGSTREKSALGDCIEQISDSVDELKKTLPELKKTVPGGTNFRWHLSNAQTWTSAALTDDETCLDGFQDLRGKTKRAVKRQIRCVAKITSNALYFIDALDTSRYPKGCTSPSHDTVH